MKEADQSTRRSSASFSVHRLAFIVCVLFLLVGCKAPVRHPLSFDSAEPVRARSIDQAIAEGVKFLEKTQNFDGSWGTGLQTRGTEIMASIPGSHDAFRVAVTGLATMACREAHADRAADRGIDYLAKHAIEVRRTDPELLYNTWAHTYSLQALAMEYKRSHRKDVLLAAQTQVEMLTRFQDHMGGWNYYDFTAHTKSPSMGATAFGTSATLVALHEAQEAGIEIPPDMIARAVRRLAFCRQPDGSYLYGTDYQYIPRLPANQKKGGLGRMQAANFALLSWQSPKVTVADATEGYEYLIENHMWLGMGRKRPFPHEAWYQTSGYYYYFGHYYAARLIQTFLKPEDHAKYFEQLSQHILPYQESDGSWWDYAMWDYHKPYGTAFAVMSLLRIKNADRQ